MNCVYLHCIFFPLNIIIIISQNYIVSFGLFYGEDMKQISIILVNLVFDLFQQLHNSVFRGQR